MGYGSTRSPLLRQAAGAAIVLAVFSHWGYSYYAAHPLGPMWDVAILGAFFVGLIAVFGWETVKRGTDTAQDVATSEDDDSEE